MVRFTFSNGADTRCDMSMPGVASAPSSVREAGLERRWRASACGDHERAEIHHARSRWQRADCRCGESCDPALHAERWTHHAVAGTGKLGTAGFGGDPLACELARPHGVTVGPDGALYITDSYNDRILKIVP
jgi:hypothetical protein